MTLVYVEWTLNIVQALKHATAVLRFLAAINAVKEVKKNRREGEGVGGGEGGEEEEEDIVQTARSIASIAHPFMAL